MSFFRLFFFKTILHWSLNFTQTCHYAICPSGLQETQPSENSREEKSPAEMASTLVSTEIKCVGVFVGGSNCDKWLQVVRWEERFN